MQNQMAKFALTASMTTLLAGIAAGTTTHVAKSADVDALAKEGYLEVNPAMLDANGNAAVRLTEKGTASVPTSGAGSDTPAPETKPVLFAIAANVELPAIQRSGNTKPRPSKYPLKDIPLGGAIFIPAEEGKDAKKMSKQFGSMVADFNKDNTDKYLTTRYVPDGKASGFALPDNPDAFAGKAGIGIYSRPVSERKERKKAAPATGAAA
jgi:hypothetical protein